MSHKTKNTPAPARKAVQRKAEPGLDAPDGSDRTRVMGSARAGGAASANTTAGTSKSSAGASGANKSSAGASGAGKPAGSNGATAAKNSSGKAAPSRGAVAIGGAKTGSAKSERGEKNTGNASTAALSAERAQESASGAQAQQTGNTVFRVRKGFQLNRGDADVVGARLLDLERQLGRLVQAEDVFQDAQNPASPLHRLYQARGLWDDAAAARHARLDYARYLLRAVEIVRLGHDGREVNAVPIFRNVVDEEDNGETGYESAPRIVQRPKALLHVISTLRTMMESCQRQMAQWEALAGVRIHINRALAELTRIERDQ